MPFAAAISEHSVAANAASEVADEVAASIGPAPDAGAPRIPVPGPRRVPQLLPAVRDAGRSGNPSVRGRVEFRRGRLQVCDRRLGHDAV